MRPRRPAWVRRLKIGLASFFLVFLIGVIAVGVLWFQALNAAAKKLPLVENTFAAAKIPPSEIVSADGKVLFSESDQFTEPVNISEVPKIVQEAIIAAEDRRFFEHSGVDWRAIARAAFLGAKNGGFSQGGSTLTMQLAKLIASNGQRTFHRKLDDAALAYEMEHTWSKERILQAYLNLVYFGSGAVGIKAAASVYFNKPLDKLTAGEAAMLARCVRRPSRENPFADLSAAVANRNVVLGIMRDEKMISESEYEKSIKEKVHLAKARPGSKAHLNAAPFFVNDVIAQLKANGLDHYLVDGGYKIITTLDSSLQAKAEDELDQLLDDYRSQRVTSGCFVMLDRDGRILVEVGGPDFRKSQYNLVTMGAMQPGSSFKPIVYSTAISKGLLTESSQISGARLTVNMGHRHEKSIHNDGDYYPASMSVTSALAQSINTAAVRAIQMVGPQTVVDFAHNTFGITSELGAYPTLALGASAVHPIEMARAYSVFMLNGSRFTPFSIDRIEDAGGNVVASFGPKIDSGVLDTGVTDQVRDMLRAVVEHGTGYYAHDIPDAMGKTGTTSDNKDAWFDGFTKNYLAIAWTGNPVYNKRLKVYVPAKMSSSVFGGTVSIKLWAAMIKAAEAANPDLQKAGQDRAASAARSNVPVSPPPQPAKTDEVKIHTEVVGKPNDPGSLDAAPAPGTAVPGGAGTGGPAGTNGGGTPTGTGTPSGGQTPSGKGPSDGTRTASESGRKGNKVQYVTVEVCADSGMLATPYCPEVVKRRFVKGTEPKKYCPLHHP